MLWLMRAYCLPSSQSGAQGGELRRVLPRAARALFRADEEGVSALCGQVLGTVCEQQDGGTVRHCLVCLLYTSSFLSPCQSHSVD